MGDDVEQCMMPIRANMALYIGGMGARDKNFYNNYAKALGFADAAVEIQDHFWLDAKMRPPPLCLPSLLTPVIWWARRAHQRTTTTLEDRW